MAEKKKGTALSAVDIGRTYRTGEEELEVLAGVNLEVQRGELLAIMGDSGVGKSTLLHILGTLDRPTAGRLSIDSTDVLALGEGELAQFRNKNIGFVFQFHHLLPEFTALENVMMPGLVSGASPQELAAEAEGLLEMVGLAERRQHRPGELSGGECQRVAMVRALIRRPLVVFADEPSGNLDHNTSTRLHGLIRDLAHSRGQAFVIMTHDRNLARAMDRVGRLEDGVLRFGDDLQLEEVSQ